jgi:hypothetical protein
MVAPEATGLGPNDASPAPGCDAQPPAPSVSAAIAIARNERDGLICAAPNARRTAPHRINASPQPALLVLIEDGRPILKW